MFIKFLKKNIFIILLILASLWQGRYLFNPGFYTFSDESHIANLHQMIKSLKSGQIPPRWAPNSSYNFGHPFFIFYYLLPFFVASFFNIFLNFGLIWSLKITFFISIVGSGIAMYFLSRQFFTKFVSFCLALIYLFTPYRAVDLYVRGAVGEMYGFLLMPLVLLSFVLLIKNTHKKYLAFAVVTLFFLIISHNLTLIIFFPVLLFLSLSLLLSLHSSKTERLKSFFRLVTAIAISLFFSAFYLIPVIFEKKYLQAGTPFNPIDHFPFLKQLILPYWGYGASVWGPTDELSFNIGISNLIGVILICILFIFLKSNKFIKFIASLLICFFASVFMMNIRSYPIWQIIPIASYIQFPWRFLILTTFLTPLLIGFISYKKQLSSIPFILAILSILTTVTYFKPHTILDVDDNYFLNRFFINQNSQQDSSLLSDIYHLNSEDYLPLTIWTKKRPLSLPEKIEANPNISLSNVNYLSDISYSFDTTSTTSATLKINNYYYPGWQATINQKSATVFPIDDLGRIGLDIPAGQNHITIKFTKTPLRRLADIISLVSIALFSFYMLREKQT